MNKIIRIAIIGCIFGFLIGMIFFAYSAGYAAGIEQSQKDLLPLFPQMNPR